MKKIYINTVMLLGIAGLITTQSCKKDDAPTPVSYLAAVPSSPVPGKDAIIPYVSGDITLNLKWSGTATNAIKWDVYFDNVDGSTKIASNVTTNAYDVVVKSGGTYYWKVVTVDANNVKSESPVWNLEVNSNPLVPTLKSPTDGKTAVSCNPTIAWTAKDAEHDKLTYDLYIGTTNTPGIAYADLADSTFTLTNSLSENTDYYWKVVAKDPYGGKSESVVRKFTTGLLPINTYTGLYTADEPAEAYSYDVEFTKVSTTSIQTLNYWNSSWKAVFAIDLTKLTYSLPLTTWGNYSGIESGIIDPKTGTMTGTYTIFSKGAIVEQGTHTYTKKP